MDKNKQTDKSVDQETAQDGQTRQPRRFPSVGLAVASGAFTLVVAVCLIVSHFNQQTYRSAAELDEDTLFVEQLAGLRRQIAENPRDEELKAKLRKLDFEVRDSYFAAQDFTRRGAYLLLVGVCVFVLALKRAIVVRQLPPLPSREAAQTDRDAADHTLGRRAVAITGLALLGGALALATMESIELVVPDEPEVVVGETGSGQPSEGSGVTPPAPASQEELAKNWPRFRGLGGLGISPYLNLAAQWDGESGEGILWKTELLLPGHNSPVVWGNKVFLSGADEEGKEVYCFDGDTGDLVWRKPVDNIPRPLEEELDVASFTGYAASTMACDGARVYAIFADGDVACFDFEGNRLWARNMGPQDNTYGYASSLAFYQELLFIQFDQGEYDDDKSKLFALDVYTGVPAWEHTRPVAGSWTSPIVIETDTGAQVITCSNPWIFAYEPTTGEVLWQANLLADDPAPAPIYSGGLLLAIQPYMALYALRTDGRGDVTESHLAWDADCMAPDICTPVSNGELIFLLTSLGELACYETATGKMLWEDALDGEFQASPSLVGEWLWLLSQDGEMFRVKAARTFELSESVSSLGEATLASPAFADGRSYIRGEFHLFCIGKE